MQRDSKLGYGFLLVGAGVPYLIDKALGLTAAIICSVACVVFGGAFLLAGARHKEGEYRPRRKIWEYLVIAGALGTLVVLVSVGVLRVMPKKEIEKSVEHTNEIKPDHSQAPNSMGKNTATKADHPEPPKQNLEAVEKKRIAEGVSPALAHYDVAKERLLSDPEKLSLYDLYLTDFEQSEVKHNRTLVIRTTPEIRMETAVVQQIETGTEFVMFYIPYNRGTDQLCLYLRGKYQGLIDKAHDSGTEIKVPGESEQVTAKTLVFSKRIFIYHETYLSPEQTIFVRNFYLEQGVTVSFRSTDYLENRKLEAKVKKLEKHKSP